MSVSRDMVPATGSPTLYIPGWKKHFENNRTRELKVMEWVPIPVKMDGDGYTEIIQHPRGAMHYAAWIAIIFVASRTRTRGSLVRDNGQPHDPASLSRISKIPVKVFAEAIPRLIEIGWLGIENTPYENKEDTRQIPQEGAVKLRESRSHPAGRCGETAGIPQEGAVPSRDRARDRGSRGSTGSSIEEGSESLEHRASSHLPITNAPFEEFCNSFRGPIEDTAWRVFGQCVNGPDDLAAITQNTPLWMQTKAYGDGFHGAIKFIRSGVWKRPPKEQPTKLVGGEVQSSTLRAAQMAFGRKGPA